MTRSVLCLLVLAGSLLTGVNAGCSIQNYCWSTGCTVQVYTDPWTPNAVVRFTFTSDDATVSPDEIWNAIFLYQNGKTYTVQLASYSTNLWGFNVRGMSEIPRVNCDGSAPGTPSPTTPQTTPQTSGTTSPGSGILLPNLRLQSSFSRMIEFMNTLTTIVDSASSARAVHSSGGAADGVVSEGQGYGLLIAASVAATTSDDEREMALNYAFEIFRGWKRMCELTDQDSCQGGGYICEGNPCLPNWKFTDNIARALGTGAAADGDADSILGMIIMVETSVGEVRPWWNEVASWAYQSCKAFMDFNTILNTSGTKRILRIGSCWGGWDCANPSIYAPAHYRVFRDYMLKYASTYATASEGLDYRTKWNDLINTVYLVLEANQCPSTGLTTNWFVPFRSDPSSGGSTICSGSGTPAAEFGSEASRSIWRVALDVFWFPEEATQGVGAATYSARVANQVISKMKTTDSSCLSTHCVGNLDTGCFVTSVMSNWLDNAFMYGPTFSSLLPLLVGGEAADQQRVLDLAATKVDSQGISDYYSGSWTALATLTLSGDLAALKPLLTGLI
ncbi:PREDICTED: uncharacterized protein LOC106805923 [Priapulus caudatus]|uniref:Uncharacterized protein LOC106805923 n=1 Tax=Priapulus caudatus TaxID=37621 RepID=A0ABM1DTB1_PRICU|nr:PREDICTED: uncharacterized protein LOC106805923 [Priapulus caudatus]